MERKHARIGELAKFYNVSTDILRHYDKIGLLKPSYVGDNGYRYYGMDSILLLEQILIYRNLDMPLEQIKALLNQETLNTKRYHEAIMAQKAAIKRKIDLLERQMLAAERYERLLDVDHANGSGSLVRRLILIMSF